MFSFIENNIDRVVTEIIESYSISQPIFDSLLIIYTNLDLQPLFSYQADSNNLFLNHINNEITVSGGLGATKEKNAFYLSKAKNTIVVHQHKQNDQTIVSIALPLILNNTLVGFLGGFSSQESIEMISIIEIFLKAVVGELKASYKKSKLELIIRNENIDIFDNYLTERELEIIRKVIEGYKDCEIEKMLCISKSTVRAHINKIFGKLEVKSKNELVNFFFKRKLKLISKEMHSY